MAQQNPPAPAPANTPPTVHDVVAALDAASNALVNAAASFLAAGDRNDAASANDSSGKLLRLASQLLAQDVIGKIAGLKDTAKRLSAAVDAINAEAAKIGADQASLAAGIKIATDFALVIVGAGSAQPLNAVGPLVDLLKGLGVNDPGT